VPLPTDKSADQKEKQRVARHCRHDPVLVEALAQLDPAYRLPILLHYYADLPLEQVARSLNLTIPATKSRLHRARALLRNSLAESEEVDR
jgi:RNA polymerase sigma factor (sigma-70 family)